MEKTVSFLTVAGARMIVRLDDIRMIRQPAPNGPGTDAGSVVVLHGYGWSTYDFQNADERKWVEKAWATVTEKWDPKDGEPKGTKLRKFRPS